MFTGFTQGSIHQVQSAKPLKGLDWDIDSSRYNKVYPTGMTANFKLPDVKNERNTILSNHIYNPQITGCVSVTPGKDWARRPEDYETYRLKGMTNDQRFVMPKFKPNTIKTQIKHTENQYNLYHEINPLERAITSIPHIIATASRQEHEASQNAEYYRNVSDGNFVHADQAPGAIDPVGAREARRQALNRHIGHRAPMQHDPSSVDSSEVQSESSSSAPSGQSEESEPSGRESVQSADLFPSQPPSEVGSIDSGYSTPQDQIQDHNLYKRNLFKSARKSMEKKKSDIITDKEAMKTLLGEEMKSPSADPKTLSDLKEMISDANMQIVEIDRDKQTLDEAEHNGDDALAGQILTQYKEDNPTPVSNKPSLTTNPDADRVLNAPDSSKQRRVEDEVKMDREEEDPFALSEEAQSKLDMWKTKPQEEDEDNPFEIVPETTPTEVMDDDLELRAFKSQVTDRIQDNFKVEHLPPTSNQRAYVLFEKRAGTYRPVEGELISKTRVEQLLRAEKSVSKKDAVIDTLPFNMMGDAIRVGKSNFFVMMYDKRKAGNLKLRQNMPYKIEKKKPGDDVKKKVVKKKQNVGVKKGSGMRNNRVINATRNRYSGF